MGPGISVAYHGSSASEANAPAHSDVEHWQRSGWSSTNASVSAVRSLEIQSKDWTHLEGIYQKPQQKSAVGSKDNLGIGFARVYTLIARH